VRSAEDRDGKGKIIGKCMDVILDRGGDTGAGRFLNFTVPLSMQQDQIGK
jgi:hypothetical protein